MTNSYAVFKHHRAEVGILYNDCGLYLNINADNFKTISKYFTTSMTIGLFHCSHIDVKSQGNIGVIEAAAQQSVRTQHFEEEEEKCDTIKRIMTNTEGSIRQKCWTAMINKIMSLIHTAQCLTLIMHHSGLCKHITIVLSCAQRESSSTQDQILKFCLLHLYNKYMVLKSFALFESQSAGLQKNGKVKMCEHFCWIRFSIWWSHSTYSWSLVDFQSMKLETIAVAPPSGPVCKMWHKLMQWKSGGGQQKLHLKCEKASRVNYYQIKNTHKGFVPLSLAVPTSTRAATWIYLTWMEQSFN